MTEHEYLAERFETHRAHLRAVAYRMLGSADEADDAVQEAWIRLSRADAGRVDNLAGWLTTVVARVCLDMLRSRKSRREEPLSLHHVAGNDPEHEVLLADSVGLAMLVVLETLAPAERVAFVLHDLFGLPFDEIAPIVGRTPSAARQLASRGRRRVRGADPATGDLTLHREIVDAFLAASRGGDFEGLLAMLDPDVVVRADEAAVKLGAEREVRGAAAAARTFAGRARAAQPALVNGVPGLLWSHGSSPRVAFAFTIRGGTVTAIELIADPARLADQVGQ
ncbi:MAG: sigma-70 family RNA polymerase sigma factor [Chloroflexi bacterium]|nr:MAG: sigma-70 family RNA polymerase sigma factor [Chloroflexota bacterium]TMG66817.1 MAG: sigma-70 family RNA polymerase sigma factor [Chloroflexota bacterium]